LDSVAGLRLVICSVIGLSFCFGVSAFESAFLNQRHKKSPRALRQARGARSELGWSAACAPAKYENLRHVHESYLTAIRNPIVNR
jgi:hypothetical protein